MSLDELIERLDELCARCEASIGTDASPEAMEAAAEAARELALVAEAVQERTDAIGRVMDRWQRSADVCRQEAKALRDRADRMEARRSRLAAYVLAVMSTRDVRRIEGECYTLTMLAGRERVVVDDAGAIPSALLRVPKPEPAEPDKQAIGDALKAGQDVPGARLERGEPTLRVYS